MSGLFDSLRLRDITFRNRIAVSPMCQYSSVDGFANDWHFVHLGSRAVGGAALVMTEAAAVAPEGRISPQDLGIWQDGHIEMLARIAAFVSAHGAEPGMQLAHAGRKASMTRPWEPPGRIEAADGGWAVVGPSPVPYSETYHTPVELDLSGIAAATTAFAEAARRALGAGFRVLEIHAAHGYLLQEFLSPISNHRTDRYGGAFENRIRFLTEVVGAVRQVWPDRLPLLVRISAVDWADGGWTLDDSVALARVLGGLGVDLVDCSSGGNAHGGRIPAGPGYQAGFAERIRRETGVPTGAVGFITDPAQADHVIRSGQADLVLLARELLRDPYWPLRAAAALGRSASWPAQYLRAAPAGSPARERAPG
jgi:2,4-dienoyl-CoA reductase-like NADH-dependent reductase (Old Yellow Enzyme family)